ncbi:MAG: SH3 domain-containing protein, partial [Anaerolineae bacterium]|nr:SH3 domain-containing protein [Anaerolineae bacterium]
MTRRAAKQSLGLLLSLVLAVLLGACNLLTSPDSVQSAISGPPVVQIAAPPANATYLESVAVNIQALVTNAGADIDRVEILVDGTIIQTLQQPNPGGAPSFSIAQAWQAAGTGAHTLSVQAFRADGSSSAPATVTVNVISQAQMTPTLAEQQANPTAQTQPGGNQTQPTTPPQQVQPTTPPTAVPASPVPQASPTPNVPTATFLQGVNVRSGPSTAFVPPIGSFAAGQATEILARTPAGDWYKVRYYNGEGWVFGQLLSVSGDTSRIAVDPGPPIPQPTAVPPTPIPPTPVPVANVNLVAGTIRLTPASPNCNETIFITVDVANFG